jgi:hypothetical protein
MAGGVYRYPDVKDQENLATGSLRSNLRGDPMNVRDGSVVAAIDFPSLGGVACRGSGIQET